MPSTSPGEPRSETQPRSDHKPNQLAWAAYAAFALALLYALVSLYWAIGGTRGINTLGGSIERLARSQTAAAALVSSVVIVLKLAGGFLALALVQPWGRRLPRRLVLITGCVASGFLLAYGLIYVSGEALVEVGILKPTSHVDWHALRWHLALWDMWFLIWGVFLGLAVLGFQCSALNDRSPRGVRSDHTSP